jgi:hypothetical protein
MEHQPPGPRRLVVGIVLVLAIVPTLFLWSGGCGAASGECQSAPTLGWPIAVGVSSFLLVGGVSCIATWAVAAIQGRENRPRRPQ